MTPPTPSLARRSLRRGITRRPAQADTCTDERKGETVRYLRSRTSRAGPQTGQTMAEYAIVLAVICIGVLTSATLLSGAISGGIDRVAGLVASVT